MTRFFKTLLVFFVLAVSTWIAFMSVLPILFIRQIEKKHEIVLKGERNLILIQPRFKVKKASFVWKNRVELVQGDFEIMLDPWAWVSSRLWAMSLQGDGAKLRFLGDWLRKTGVKEVQTTRLRLALDFDDGEIREIRKVEVVSPNYQLQIQSREARAS
ncbi:MAG TPA: hypothetical protein DIS66_07375 [Candidatus Omnitrophica bacterium]|nr:hypothetical protein [Candidatus Omnitrophota bacterium]